MIAYLIALLSRFTNTLPKDEKGQDAAEYALLIALIALAIVLAVTALGGQIAAVFNAIVAALPA
jgi:pilus assembly protein Flp/PilA